MHSQSYVVAGHKFSLNFLWAQHDVQGKERTAFLEEKTQYHAKQLQSPENRAKDQENVRTQRVQSQAEERRKNIIMVSELFVQK